MRNASTVLALASLSLAACGGGSPSNGSGAGDPSREVSGVSGVLLDEAGDRLPRAQVLACMSSVCLFGQTAADGRFRFEIDYPAELVIKTDGDAAATPGRAAAMMPVRIDKARMVDVGAVHGANLPEGTPVGPASADPQTLHAGDALQLTLQRAG